MRNVILLAPFLTLATRPAPACGFYMPRVFMVSDHYGAGAFALTDHRDVPTAGWLQLAPNSYDATEIAPAPATPALTMTLLGTDGARVVQATKRVFVRNDWGRGQPMGAYAVDTGGKYFQIAVSGSHVNMTFERLAPAAWTADDARFLAANQLPWSTAAVERLGDVESLTASVDGEERTVVRRGDVLLGTFDGTVIGRLGADGMQYLLVAHDGDVRAVWL